jgi:hypothetical protein
MCSNADDARSGGGAVGEGNSFGSYFWYEWMSPPRGAREGEPVMRCDSEGISC